MAAPGIRKMRLIQLNVWSGRLQHQVAGFLKARQPDIICLQEAISFNKADAFAFQTVESIQTKEKLPYITMAPTFTFKLMEGTASYGNCIISSQPIQRSETVFTHLEHKENFDFNEDSGNGRNFIHAVIDLDGQPCNILTHHGYWIPEHKNGNEETLRQMKQLGEYIDDLEGPVILTGDFNLVPHSESLEQINRRLRNLSIEHKLKTTRNHLTHKTEVCDYIFVNDKIKVKNFEAADDLISDHKALVLDFGV
jgi:endonuclease/exonuclease/phosphatase family metal-dependent hydrolase